MQAHVVIESFALSLFTNVAVMIGAAALFVWLCSVKPKGLIGKHKRVISIGFIYFFYLYIFAQSVANTVFGPLAYGMHWTFLNILIITAFVFNVIMRSFWVTGFYIVALIVSGLFEMAQLSIPLVILWTINVTMQIWMYKYGYNFFMNSRLKSFIVLAIYGTVGFLNVYFLDPTVQLDVWFMVRQWLAFSVIATISCEFTRSVMLAEERAKRNFKLINIDQMTGTKNFGAFNTDLENYYNAFKQGGTPYSLIEFDIDHFKKINDTYGHLMGNFVLQQVAQVMRTVVKDSVYTGEVYRVGGEEFCIIVLAHNTSTTEQYALPIIQQIKTDIDALTFTTAEGETFSITVSGGQEYSQPSDNHYLDLYNQADKYLYWSKQAGRDQLTISGQVVKR